MAVIEHPITMTTVKRYRGVLDFYFQNGQQIVRSWPKKSNLVPTPAQKVQRDNFRAIECCLKAQGPGQRAAWQEWRPHTGQNWVDYVHRVWMGVASRGHLFTVPDFRFAFTTRVPGSGYHLVIAFTVPPGPPVPSFDCLVEPAPSSNSKWGWHVYDYKIQRGRFRQPRWAPSTGRAVRVAPYFFDPENGLARYLLPGNWRVVRFSVLASADSDDLALLSACRIAPFRPG